MVIKKKNLKEYKGTLMDKTKVLGLILDSKSSFTSGLIKRCGFNKAPIKTFKSLPIRKLRKYTSSNGRGDCIIGNTVYDSKRLADALSLMGKHNVELYQKGDNYPLGIKVNDNMACIAPVILYNGDKANVLTIEDVIK